MTRIVRRWLTLLGLAAALLLPATAVFAQSKGGKDDLSVGRASEQGADGSTAPDNGKSAALPYAFAGLAAMGVLLIVCMPSRKG